MGMQPTEPPQDQQVEDVAPVGESVESESQGNPAWNDMLDKVPSGLHPMITPYLSDWDKKFQEVQTRYAPYKEFAQQEIPTETIESALGLLNVLSTNPRVVYDRMVEQFGQEWGLTPQQAQQVAQQVQGQQENSDPVLDFDEQQDITKHPQFVEMMNNQNMMAAYLAQQIEQEQSSRADQALDIEINALQQKYGQWDDNAGRYILSRAAAGVPLEKANQEWRSMVDGIRQQPAPGRNIPPVLGTTGGVPSTGVDVTALNKKDTKGLVAEMIRQSMAERD